VKSFFINVRWKWLRLVLATLLSLHAGFAQAAMVMPAEAASVTVEVVQQPSADDAALMAEGMPCHQQVDSPAGPDHSDQHEDGCCKAGSCHCAAACGLPSRIARMAAKAGFTVSPFRFLSVPADCLPPDLRPPIF
jgi:hypothetical protein